MVQLIFVFYILCYFPKIIRLNGKKDFKRETQCFFLLKKETFKIKRDPKSGLDLLRDPGLPKRDPVGSSEFTSEKTSPHRQMSPASVVTLRLGPTSTLVQVQLFMLLWWRYIGTLVHWYIGTLVHWYFVTLV